MKSKASAPGKIILFGEHFVVYGASAILCAINKRVTVSSEKISEKKIKINSNIGELDLPVSVEIDKIDSPLKPFFYLGDKIIRKYSYDGGVEITVDSEIPLGVGLGSSSACCVAGAASISKLFGDVSKQEILELAIEAEKTIYSNTSGADCTVCTFGGIMKYDKKNGFRKIESHPEFQLVIANSNLVHSTDKVVSEVKKFKENNEEFFSQLCEKEEKLIEDIIGQIDNPNYQLFGQKIQENQDYLESIGVSNETLQDMIKIANKTSYGSKITGAGGGGCIFALTDENNRKPTLDEFQKNNYQCFSAKIDYKGLDTF